MYKEIGSEISINDCTHWIHECNRFLFLAKVHLQEPSVTPQISGDPINYIETIINMSNIRKEGIPATKLLVQNFGEESTAIDITAEIEFKIDVPTEEVSELKATFEKIHAGNWMDLDRTKIEKSQEILYNLLKSIKKY